MSGRVAAAIQEAFHRQKIEPWHGINLSTVIPPVDWVAVGCAAIEALREPTPGMLAEGWQYSSLSTSWDVMIDTILAEEKAS